jgi:polyisoprenoid-binding protein YceI
MVSSQSFDPTVYGQKRYRVNEFPGARMSSLVRYRIDTKKSLFTVHPFATGVAAALSHGLNIAIRDFAGELKFIPGTLQDASIHMKIKADSLSVNDDMKESDRREVERTMREQVLRASEHPEIEFKSATIKANMTTENHYRLDVTGYLNLNGTVRAHSFDAQVVFGTDSLRANGQFSAKQSDYEIPLISAAGGMIKVRDEVKFHFYIVALKEA